MQVDPELTKHFNEEEIKEYEKAFVAIDTNNNGSIEKSELIIIFKKLGYITVNEINVNKIFAEMDVNKDSTVSFNEFLQVMKLVKEKGAESNFIKTFGKDLKGLQKQFTKGGSSFSTLSEEERTAFSKVINNVLADDPHCKSLLPIDPTTNDLYTKMKNGVMLCKLINRAKEGTIKETAINVKEPINIFAQTTNLNLGINSAKAIGLQIVGIHSDTFQEEKQTQILGVLWQLIKLVILGQINLNRIPQLIKLLNEGETEEVLAKISAEDLLIRWFNYHLKAGGYEPPLKNFDKDIMDCERYTVLLNQLDPRRCDKSAMDDFDMNNRAQSVIGNAKKVGANTYITENDIITGITKLNVLFTASIFNACHGLDDKKDPELIKEDETNAYGKVINSVLESDESLDSYLPIHPKTYDLFYKLYDGVLACKLISKAAPEAIDESKIIMDKNDKNQCSTNYALINQAAKQANLPVEFKPEDFDNADQTSILDKVWPIIKKIVLNDITYKNYRQFKKTLQKGEEEAVLDNEAPEDLLKRWFNYHLTNAQYDKPLTNWSDDVKDCEKYIILMNQIDDNKCDIEPLQESDMLKKAESTLVYSRNLGTKCYIVEEDILSGNDKLNLLFSAAIFHANHGLDDPQVTNKELTIPYARIISHLLSKDDSCAKYLPIDGETYDFFNKLSDGVLACKLLSKAAPEAIDASKIIYDDTNPSQSESNFELLTNAAQSVNVNTDGLNNEAFAKKDQDAILEGLWPIIRKVVLGNITLKKCPNLYKTLNEGEERSVLETEEPEDILKRWFNYHLRIAKHDSFVENFEDDVKDCTKYTILMNQLDNELCDTAPLQEEDILKRAQCTIVSAKKLGAQTLLIEDDIINGNDRLNTLFTASIFNAKTGLDGEPDLLNDDETTAFAKIINTVMADEASCSNYIPIKPHSYEFFTKLKDGVLLCRLINKFAKGTIDERCINQQDDMEIGLIRGNLNLAISSAKSLGCSMMGIDSESFENEKQDQMLEAAWQLIRLIIIGDITLKQYPQLIRLIQGKETKNDLLRVSPEDMLLRWFNYHLTEAKYEKMVTNYNTDIQDSEKYTILLNQLDSAKCGKEALEESDMITRAGIVLSNATKLEAKDYISDKDIASGNTKLNIIFVGSLFNICIGLPPPTDEEAHAAAELLNDDVEGEREERSFRMWANSLGIPDFRINNLYEDSRGGVLLLKIEDKIKPGCVNWQKVKMKYTNPFDQTINCNEAVDAAKKSGYTIVGIGGADIFSGNKKFILAIVWQLVRSHTLQVIGNKTEDELVKWGNELVPEEYRITGLKDAKLKNSLFFIHLMNAVDKYAINWNIIVKDPVMPEDLENNAKYAISVARCLGAVVFLVWEDITEIKPKLLLTFLASIFEVNKQKQEKLNN